SPLSTRKSLTRSSIASCPQPFCFCEVVCPARDADSLCLPNLHRHRGLSLQPHAAMGHCEMFYQGEVLLRSTNELARWERRYVEGLERLGPGFISRFVSEVHSYKTAGTIHQSMRASSD